MTRISEQAPAKINLMLHVGMKRADGYHELESLVAFASLHDEVTVEKAPQFTLDIIGSFASALDGRTPNLVLTAATALARGVTGVPPGARITLRKDIPVAAGLGGGSSDAAAALRALLRLAGVSASRSALTQIAAGTGADVPVCLEPGAHWMWGIGQHIEPAPALPEVSAVLVNPKMPLATADVFAALGRAADDPRAMDTPNLPARFADAQALASYLALCRNDLEETAGAMVYEVADAREALFATGGCLIARMTGSGPTCFGLYATAAEADAAAGEIARAHPPWWVRPVTLF